MKQAKKISILCHDLSHNCLGRSHILATALQQYYEVEIIGPALSGDIWAPLRNDKSVKYVILDKRKWLKNLRLIDGDVILASKTKGTSFGYALAKRITTHKSVILDIDDWDFGFFFGGSLHQKIYSLSRFWDINNPFFTWVMEHLSSHANAIIVSNSFLQRRFGGTLIPHFRDTGQFNPRKFNRTKLKLELELLNRKAILFLGTPRKHKGVLDLINAVEKLNRKDVTLLIVGVSTQNKKELPRKSFVKFLGYQPFDQIPRFLAAADLVVIFQSDSKSSQGQLPAKLFDAMSMEKPIIASSVSDIPEVLKGCGELIKPGNIDELVEKMGYLLDNPKYAKELGRKAREKCIKEYSYDAIAPKLHVIVEDVLAKARATAKT